MSGAHWRKQWPEGAIDDSSNDAETITEFNKPTPRHKPKVFQTWPTWTTFEPHTTDKNDQFQDLYSSKSYKKQQKKAKRAAKNAKK